MPARDVYTLDDLLDWGRCGPGLDPPAGLAVIGDPVAHSLSPQMHNPALAECGLALQYVRVRVVAAEVAAAIDRMRALGFVGTNVTVPHKFAAFAHVGGGDVATRQLGAVNTVVFRDGAVAGFSTDGPGFSRAVREEFGIELRDLRVLVIGAGGGAGRAVAFQCAEEGCARLALANRTREKAEALAAELGALAGGTPARDTYPCGTSEAELRAALAESDLVVNSTPLGMSGGGAGVVPTAWIAPYHLVYDMVYNPPQTPLLAEAAARGARTGNGLSMLVHQGALAFEHWFDRPAPVETMRRALAAAAGTSAGR
jgi:shikimate dehydrogenase